MSNSDSDKPKERLLQSAIHRIAHHGLEGLEIRVLCEEADASTSQFARYYANKEGIITAVFQRGWSSLENHVFMRMFSLTKTVDGLAENVLHGAVDALEKDHEAVSATLLIAFSTLGQSVRDHLKDSAARSRLQSLIKHLPALLPSRPASAENMEVLILIYSAVLHRLVLATPMYRASAPKFDREVFVKLMRRMIRALIDAPDESASGSKRKS